MPQAQVDDLVALLDLEAIEVNIFRGVSPIFNMSASFHREEPGLDFQLPMPDVPGPNELPTLETPC